MQSTRPNIFDHARSELCQDAFLAWLCEWADPRHAALDPLLHDAGKAFVGFLYEQHGAVPPDYSQVRVETQYHNMDLVVFLRTEAGESHCILIEDKVFAGTQGGKLDRYIEVLKKAHPGTEILPVHLQTWFIGHPIPSHQYRSIDLQDMVEFLLREEWDPISDRVFTSFRDHLKYRFEHTQDFSSKKVAAWKTDHWMGFFNELRKRVAGHGCSATFEQNPRSTGPLAIFRMENVQLPGGQISCVEIYGRNEPLVTIRINSRDEQVIDRLYQQLRPLAAENGIALEPAARPRSGSTAMVATVQAKEFLTADGRMDIDRAEAITTSLNQVLAARAVAAARASLVE